MTSLLYFEDFPVGQVRDCGSRTIALPEILAFARDFDPQPFHVDAQAAAKSPFGGIIASGWHTASIAMRMQVDAMLSHTHSLGSPGIDELRWKKPVRPGDTLSLKLEVLEARPSKSKPGQGSILTSLTLSNQHGEVVLTMKGWGMLRRRPT